jgi:hypothetical protein
MGWDGITTMGSGGHQGWASAQLIIPGDLHSLNGLASPQQHDGVGPGKPPLAGTPGRPTPHTPRAAAAAMYYSMYDSRTPSPPMPPLLPCVSPGAGATAAHGTPRAGAQGTGAGGPYRHTTRLSSLVSLGSYLSDNGMDYALMDVEEVGFCPWLLSVLSKET